MWTDTSILYQIYPLGLCDAPWNNDAPPDAPAEDRISRVLSFLPHLTRLGVGGVYFSPLFESDHHGYDTRDFFRVDRRLGTNEDLKRVTDALHAAGIRVLFDGVFHHVGRGFGPFLDVLKNRENSRYRDWFYLRFDGDTPYHDGLWYDCWEGHYELVKLNLGNPEVREHLFSAIRFWREEFGIDGLRLDVAYLLDRGFLGELRRFVKTLDPDFVLIGEVLFGDYNLLVNDGMLDSCTNYENYKSRHSAIRSRNLFELSYSLHRQFGDQPWCIYRGKHLVTFAENHDVSRIATILGDASLVRVCYALLLTEPGIPTIYYGGEWGVCGDKQQGDGTLRPAFAAPEWNALTDLIAALIRLRRENPVFSFGGYRNLVERNEFLVFERTMDGQRAIVGVNIGDTPVTAYHDGLHGEFRDPLGNATVSCGGALELPPKGFRILLCP